MKLARIGPQAASVALVMVALSTTLHAEGNAAAGKAKTWTCEGCHGIPDYRTAYPEVYSVPKLGGQSAGYIVKALQDYKSGSRKHPTMRAIASRLSDQDIADIAAYYSGAERGD